MNIDPDSVYGVVSGDVVGSSKISKAERPALLNDIAAASTALQSWLGEVIPLPVDVFGGDSWQMLVVDPAQTLAAALFFRTHLRGNGLQADTRCSIAVGTVDFVPDGEVSQGDGEAYRLSGRGLETLGKRRMGFSAADASIAARWDLVVELLDAIVTRQWTTKRCHAILGRLQGWTQEQIGEAFDPPIEQATVNRHLRTANWPTVERAVQAFCDAMRSQE